jgi:hypothetical protein
VIDLYFNQHKTYAEIAQIERISPCDIHAIIKEEKARRQKHKDRQQQVETSGKAYELFSKRYTPLQVAIELNIRQSEATKYYREYWELKRLHILNSIYKETDGKLGPFLKLYKQLMKKRRMSVDQVVNVVDTAIHKLPYIESLYIQTKEQVDTMQHTRQFLVNDIEARKNKISILDKTAFSSEQQCKIKEQEVHELTAKKDRIEKLIANILNGEDYSKVKQVAKENVKAVLSDSKILISTVFAALIQTIKADPQLVKLIQNIPTVNDGEQHKGNNVIKYLESNKDSLLYLTEKNYENLVEALTDNSISSAAASSNSILSLPQSSSTFRNSFDQNDTYRIEYSEIYPNSKGDISD